MKKKKKSVMEFSLFNGTQSMEPVEHINYCKETNGINAKEPTYSIIMWNNRCNGTNQNIRSKFGK